MATFQQTCLVAGLLYGLMTYPSFPVVDELFRLRYTAKKRQTFADVFVFDKCRYVFDQFLTVNTVCFAIEDLKLQIVFRMVMDGLRKHWGGSFAMLKLKMRLSFPERKKIEDIL